MSNHYEERDAFELDKAGGYYTRHVVAMTKEGLHSKSDIAAELAHRDYEIDKLKAQVERLLKAFDEFHGIAASCDGWETFPQKALDDACDAMMATSAQSLAEIKAQAAREGYMKCARDFDLDRQGVYLNGWATYQLADFYADQIRQQAIKEL